MKKTFWAVSVLAGLSAWAGDNPPVREAAVKGGDGRSAGAGSLMGRPVLGYVARSSPLEVRAILGVPGASVFSDALAIPSESSSLRVAPGSSANAWAWVERGGEAPAILHLGPTRAGALTGVTGALSNADIAAFSPAGTSLALYSARSGHLQVLTGLPDTPRIAQDLETQSLPGAPDALAVSDDAGAVLLASGTTVYLLAASGAAQPVQTLAGTAAMAFLPGTRNAAVVDRGAGSVYLVRNAGSGVSSGLLASGLAGAGEISATGDGRSLVLTNPGASSIWLVDATTGALGNFNTQVAAAGLSRLADQDSYLISSEAGQPAWMFIPNGAGSAGPRTVFVPSASAARVSRE